MFENNKYLLIFLIIVGLGVVAGLVYKIIRLNDTIRELDEDKKTLENALVSKDFTIKQYNNGKNKKIERSDHETDYCHGKAPIEVFNNNATELNMNKPKIVTSEQNTTPQITGKIKVVADAISNVAMSRVKSISPIIELADNKEDSLSTLSFIDQAIAHNDISNITLNTNDCLSDTMYIVTGNDEESTVEYEVEEEDEDEEEEEEEEEEDEADEEAEEEDEEADDGEEGDEEDTNEGGGDGEDETNNDVEELNANETNKTVTNDENSSNHQNEEKEEEEEEYEYVYEEYEVEYDEEEEKRKKEETKKKLLNLQITEIRVIAKRLNIKMSNSGKMLNKNELIDKIVEQENFEY